MPTYERTVRNLEREYTGIVMNLKRELSGELGPLKGRVSSLYEKINENTSLEPERAADLSQRCNSLLVNIKKGEKDILKNGEEYRRRLSAGKIVQAHLVCQALGYVK